MPVNNSVSRRNVRRREALARFTLDPRKTDDKEYNKRKSVEKAALERHVTL
jgi:hypothetical protein